MATDESGRAGYKYSRTYHGLRIYQSEADGVSHGAQNKRVFVPQTENIQDDSLKPSAKRTMDRTMAIRELRRSVRFQPQAEAQLRFEGGVRIPCTIRDISMGGAYLIRLASPSREVVIEPGTRVRVRVQEPKNGSRYTLNADVVRTEPNGGPGLAIRFRLTEDHLDPVVDYVRAAGQHVGAPPEALQTPHLQVARRGSWGPVRRIGKAVLQISTLGSSLGFAFIGVTWLDSVMF